MEGGSRVVLSCNQREESMKVFREGIGLAFNIWWRVRWYVKVGCFEHEPLLTFDTFCDCLFSCFIQPEYIPYTKYELRKQLTSFFNSFDKSIQEFSDQLVTMYLECLQGDFSSIHIIKEANARRLMWRQINKFEMEKDPDHLEKLEIVNLTRHDRMHVWHTTSFKNTIKKANLILSPSTHLLTPYEKVVSKSGTETSAVEIIKEEANISSQVMQKQANSSEMDGSRVLQGHSMRVFKEGVSLFVKNLWTRHVFVKAECGSNPSLMRVLQGHSMRVFKEGVSLFVKNLWTRHVFVKAECGSNPSLMLQDLADNILFWFTQTIKPLSFDYMERILRNEMYSLPLTVHAITNGITKEVAKKLMVMYEECLQSNFSSVEILREESLSRGLGELLNLV